MEYTSADESGLGARVVLIMPIRNEATDIEKTLASLEHQTIAHERLFLVLVDGASEDATVSLAQAWLARQDIAGTVLANPERKIPIALNIGIRLASPSDIIARLDGHTVYGPTYLSELIASLETAPPNVACVGGPQIPSSDDDLEHRVVATLYSNPMGLGGADHRSGQGAKYVTQVYLGAWRPGVLQKLGGFDELWAANEDSELSARILADGRKIMWLPLDSRYKVNRTIWKTITQWGAYGFWRAQTLRRYPTLAKPRHFAPPILLLVAAIMLFTPLWPLLFLAFGAYVIAVLKYKSPEDSLGIAALSCFFFPCCQAAWSLGFIRGYPAKPDPFRSTLPICIDSPSNVGNA